MATSNISIDASFFDINVDGVTSVPQEIFFRLPDNIGGRDIETELSYPIPTAAEIDTNILYETSAIVSGTAPLMYQAEYFRTDTTYSGTVVSLVEWSTSPATLSGIAHALLEYYNRQTYSSGQQMTYVQLTFGDSTTSGTNAVAVHFIAPSSYSESTDTRVNYLNFSGDYDYWGNPIPSVSGIVNVPTTYTTFANTLSGVLDSIVDITFSGWVPGYVITDAFSVWDNRRDGTSYNFSVESTTRSGGLTGTFMDLFSVSLDTMAFDVDVYSAGLFVSPLQSDVIVLPGIRNPLNYDVWSCVPTSGTLICDVQLLSMYFDNFSLDVGEYMPASGTICVDVHDEHYNVVTSGTYFMVDGVPVSGTLTPISDGYRICYNPDDDFESLAGPTKFTARAENDNGDVLTRDFYVTFGYVVEYDNIVDKGIDFGFYNKIGVRIAASNLMNCPIDDADGFWFVSKDYYSADLKAFIVGKPLTAGQEDLTAEIYPWTTAYFYDKIFRMELTVKDYNGNEMEPFVLVFKVENLDKNNTT